MDDLLIIVGPTAVGKTELSLMLAEEIGAEIISADSMQVYRGMDIGTAKPTASERARVPHHLIDVADPREEFSVGDYLKLAEAEIREIRERGRTPLVVGGTGLYVRALVSGLFEGPKADWGLREMLMERERAEAGTLHTELMEADPEAAKRIHPSDHRRIVRALEVYHAEGTTISRRHKEHRAASIRNPARIAGLRRARPELYKRVEDRVDKMMNGGLLDEVQALRDSGCTREMVSMQAIGYKQLFAFFEGEAGLEEAVHQIKRDTKRYVKRQFTWFNAVEEVRWVDVDKSGSTEEALTALKNALEIF